MGTRWVCDACEAQAPIETAIVSTLIVRRGSTLVHHEFCDVCIGKAERAIESFMKGIMKGKKS